MKEFDKWFEEVTEKYHTVAFQPCDGWKAALEWVLSSWNRETEEPYIRERIRDELDEI